MDSRSPIAFLPQNNPFNNTFPRLKPSPRSSPSPTTSSSLQNRASPPLTLQKSSSPAVKRKASFPEADEEIEDSIMSTSPNPSPRILKRARQSSLSSKRGLPVSRILDNLDKPALIMLISNLLSRHPDLVNEVQSLAPKVTPQTALATISRLNETFHASFPYGGDKSGEYAYSRIHSAYNALLSAIGDYTTHFLPPTNISPPELLSFLDSITNILHRIPLFHNPIHNIARESAFASIITAWEQGIRYFLETNGSFSFVGGGWVERLEAHAVKEPGLRRVAEMVNSEVSWARNH